MSQEAPGTAALIFARDDARRIAATVRAVVAVPGVDLVLVIDDGSTDNTQDLARGAGAVVVRHPHSQGRAASVQTGAAVVAMRDEPEHAPRHLLFLKGYVGAAAAGIAPLVTAVQEGVADMAVGAPVKPHKLSVAEKAARRAVERESGWLPDAPLSSYRCMTREAFEAALPLARGSGLDVAMTVDVLRAGLIVTEVGCDLGDLDEHKLSPVARSNRYRDVMLAVSARAARATAERAGHAVVDRLSPSSGD